MRIVIFLFLLSISAVADATCKMGADGGNFVAENDLSAQFDKALVCTGVGLCQVKLHHIITSVPAQQTIYGTRYTSLVCRSVCTPSMSVSGYCNQDGAGGEPGDWDGIQATLEEMQNTLTKENTYSFEDQSIQISANSKLDSVVMATSDIVSSTDSASVSNDLKLDTINESIQSLVGDSDGGNGVGQLGVLQNIRELTQDLKDQNDNSFSFIQMAMTPQIRDVASNTNSMVVNTGNTALYTRNAYIDALKSSVSNDEKLDKINQSIIDGINGGVDNSGLVTDIKKSVEGLLGSVNSLGSAINKPAGNFGDIDITVSPDLSDKIISAKNRYAEVSNSYLDLINSFKDKINISSNFDAGSINDSSFDLKVAGNVIHVASGIDKFLSLAEYIKPVLIALCSLIAVSIIMRVD